MERINLIAIVVAVVLIAGAIFVSANFLQDEDSSEEVNNELEQICGINTCNQQCGGNCGVPKCGCS